MLTIKKWDTDDITDEGYITNHDPEGYNVYGIEVMVHHEYRGMKIVQTVVDYTRRGMSVFDEKNSSRSVRKLSEYTENYIGLFTELAVKYNVNIIGGSVPPAAGS